MCSLGQLRKSAQTSREEPQHTHRSCSRSPAELSSGCSAQPGSGASTQCPAGVRHLWISQEKPRSIHSFTCSLIHSPCLFHDGNSSLQRAGLGHWEKNWAPEQRGSERLGEPGHWGLEGQGHNPPLRWCTSVFLPVKWSCLCGRGVRLEEQKCQHCAVPHRGAAATVGLGLPHGDGRGC